MRVSRQIRAKTGSGLVGIDPRINNRKHASRQVGFSGGGNYLHLQLSEPNPEAFGRRARDSQAELPGAPPDDRNPGTESGIGEGIQSHLRHLRAGTTANGSMQVMPESVQQMVGTIFALLFPKAAQQQGAQV